MLKAKPLPLSDVRVTDAFWSREMDLVRDAVIPYQWEALNDRVPGAEPSWWMHNMRAATRAIAARKAGRYDPRQKLPFIVISPEGEPKPEEFYGWAFQDSDGYKWLEAVAYQLMRRPDPALERKALEAIEAIRAAQEEDGYLDTFYTVIDREQAFTNLKDHHELYCFGHLVEAAVAWHQATGRRDLLDIAERFGRCIGRQFGPEARRGCPGHEIAEMALFRLYEETGEAEWLKLACFFLNVRGTEPSTFALEENAARERQGLDPLPKTAADYVYYQAHMPVRDMKEAVGHAVRQMYLCSGMADAARETGDQAMWQACKRLWQSVTEQKLYVTGGVGSTHEGEAFSRPYDLPSDTAYSETCAAVGLAFFARRMLQAEADSRYADAMELALYNTVLAGMALDGQSFFYVNPLEVDPDACDTDQRLRHVKPVRQKWFGCACCPPNIARIVSSLPAYMLTKTDDTLYIHLYAGSTIKTDLGGNSLSLRMEADLMRSGSVRVTVTGGEADGCLAFRIPGWTKRAQIHTEGKQKSENKGYCALTGHWKAGDAVTLDFPMPVRVLSASSMVRETAGSVCFARGPLVYCAEEADNGKLLHLLRVKPDCAEAAQVDFREIAGCSQPVITVPGWRILPEEGAPLYAEYHPEETREAPVVLTPYFAWNNRGRGEMRVWIHKK